MRLGGSTSTTLPHDHIFEQIAGNGEINLTAVMRLEAGGRFAVGLPKLCSTIMLLSMFSVVLNIISHTEMQREHNDYDIDLDAPYFNARDRRRQKNEKRNRTESMPKDIDVESRSVKDWESPDHLSAQHTVHPRVACLRFKAGTQRMIEGGCAGGDLDYNLGQKYYFGHPKTSAIPLNDPSYVKAATLSEQDMNNTYVETDECKYPESQFAEKARTNPEDNVWSPRPICNDIHSIGFDWELFETRNANSTRPPAKYLTMGGAKCIWQITSRNDDNHEETFIFKSNKMSRHIKRHYFQNTAIDGLISGQLGNPRLQSAIEGKITVSDNWNHILPMYGYCGLANIVPFAKAGNLREYILRKFNEERKIDPVVSLQLALQAARGLHQVHMFVNGSPSFTHADMNPSQFLVFKDEDEVPLLQINDFNQGRFLLQNANGEVCPYMTCIKNLRGNRCESVDQILCVFINSHTRKIDHSPERYIYCATVNE